MPPIHYLSAAELARHLGQPVPRVAVFLGRYRQRRMACYILVDGAGPREARILYRTAEVWRPLLEQSQKWRAGA